MKTTRALLGATMLAAGLPLLMAGPAHADVLGGLGDAASAANNVNALGAMLNSDLANYAKQDNANEHSTATPH
ncbi:hypothetical protein [Streptomyces vietnamensis]|uniref:Secreted protein n=1 Tax=Streptomyces vietnamensis TaxID=362257 RepID=A0A0B5IJ04_9ACTN|nr:hypothetical protein [Streptomyces vietnamensis]AJF70457.1 hypothetical protein SVTN_40565 [Streptomyces vietnamensis]